MERKKDEPLDSGRADAPRQPFIPPAIAWEEDFRPIALALTCAQQAGNPPCETGPITL
jgi:hypothetical protein